MSSNVEPITVFLLGHKARVGKDTAAKLLMERHGFVRLAFAEKLKELTGDLFRMSYDQMYGDVKDVLDERYGKTPREVLQQFGQGMRAIHETIWAEYLFMVAVERLVRAGQKRFVISDFRFPNEYNTAIQWAAWRGNGTTVRAIKLTRPGIGAFNGNQDISETALDSFEQWDAVIENDETIFHLYQKLVSTKLIPV